MVMVFYCVCFLLTFFFPMQFLNFLKILTVVYTTPFCVVHFPLITICQLVNEMWRWYFQRQSGEQTKAKNSIWDPTVGNEKEVAWSSVKTESSFDMIFLCSKGIFGAQEIFSCDWLVLSHLGGAAWEEGTTPGYLHCTWSVETGLGGP